MLTGFKTGRKEILINNAERIRQALIEAGLDENNIAHTRVVWEQLGYEIQEDATPFEVKLWKKRQPKDGEDENSKNLFYLATVRLYLQNQVETKEV